MILARRSLRLAAIASSSSCSRLLFSSAFSTTTTTTTNPLDKAASPPQCHIIDSFAATPGTGNPAAVVLLPQNYDPETYDSDWMQKVAAEFNLSETAFCWPTTTTTKDLDKEEDEEDIHYGIRYFTPTVEVPLCGHATLASAAILYQSLAGDNDPQKRVVFHAPNDVLSTELAGAGGNEGTAATTTSSLISMQFPSLPPHPLNDENEISSVRTMLQNAFYSGDSDDSERQSSLQPIYIGINEEMGDLLVELTPQDFEAIGFGSSLNLQALLDDSVPGYTRGVIVCCSAAASDAANDAATTKADFFSRFFGPKAGIDEDPVTGSAHCLLAPYFATKLNKDFVVGNQKSQRGGVVQCQIQHEDKSVEIRGQAITTMSGTLFLR